MLEMEARMLTRIWKEDAKGRVIKGTVRELDVPVRYVADSPELETMPKREIKPYVKQERPIYVQVKRRNRPLRRKAGNA